ncbi:MAG: XRE family transcriptional regulator [Thermoanaerobaculia bacterium]|nr:XRE family transcriptional regulator [Thermoanaerobaculia bacterium]
MPNVEIIGDGAPGPFLGPMDLNPDSLRYILGLKLRSYRQERGWGLKDVAKATGMSVSYLSEIEKGRKYPKPDKIHQLAQALEVPFETLMSPRLDDELRPVRELFNSTFLQEFPFHLFGIEPEALVGLVTEVPSKAGALLSTVLEIGRTYGVRVEHLLFAALRSYQQLNDNYFEDIEDAAAELLRERGWSDRHWIGEEELRELLESEHGIEVDDQTLLQEPDLSSLRSVWIDGPRPRLLINGRLIPSQRAFALGRELGYLRLGLSERSRTSTYINVESFDQVIHDFKAAYFSGALLIQRDLLSLEMEAFFRRDRWAPREFLGLLRRFRTTPETFFYRLSQLLPSRFGLDTMFFVRFANRTGSNHFDLTKILNMSRLPIPLGIEPNERYCRRWSGLQMLKGLAMQQAGGATRNEPGVGIQRSTFGATPSSDEGEFLTFTLTRPLVLSDDESTSVNLSFLVSDQLMRKVRFWDDPAIPTSEVGITCERCGIHECLERAAAPVYFGARQRQKRQEAALADLLRRQRRA